MHRWRDASRAHWCVGGCVCFHRHTSASLAAYAAQAGIPGLVFVPSGQVALGKMMQTLSYGARTLIVRGDFDDCLRLVQDVATHLDVYLLNSINPYRLEGQKTIVLEMLQQLAWDAPDFIVLPAGNLGNTSAFGKALREALALGLINKLPRLIAVQAAGAAPFARSFSEGFATRYKVVAETLATAIKLVTPLHTIAHDGPSKKTVACSSRRPTMKFWPPR